jgi:hypothetical protein
VVLCFGGKKSLSELAQLTKHKKSPAIRNLTDGGTLCFLIPAFPAKWQGRLLMGMFARKPIGAV